MTAAFFPALPDGCFFGAAARSAAVLRAGRLASNLPFFLIRIPPIQKPQGDIIYFVVLYINRPFFATAFPTGTGSGILKFLLTFSGVRATLLCRGIPACLRRPYLFSRKRKDMGEKSAWTRLVHSAGAVQAGACFIVAANTPGYLTSAKVRAPVTVHQICGQLRLNDCGKNALHSKFARQYEFAAVPQRLLLPRPAREGEVAFSKKMTEGICCKIQSAPKFAAFESPQALRASVPTPIGPSGHFPLIGGIGSLCPRGAFGAYEFAADFRKCSYIDKCIVDYKIVQRNFFTSPLSVRAVWRRRRRAGSRALTGLRPF